MDNKSYVTAKRKRKRKRQKKLIKKHSTFLSFESFDESPRDDEYAEGMRVSDDSNLRESSFRCRIWVRRRAHELPCGYFFFFFPPLFFVESDWFSCAWFRLFVFFRFSEDVLVVVTGTPVQSGIHSKMASIISTCVFSLSLSFTISLTPIDWCEKKKKKKNLMRGFGIVLWRNVQVQWRWRQCFLGRLRFSMVISEAMRG